MNSNRVALVTGGTKGIGLAIVKRLLDDGYCVAAASRSSGPDDMMHLENHRRSNQYRSISVDVRSQNGIQSMITDVISTYGTLDIVVNNAGVLTASAVQDISDEEWNLVLDTNLKGAFFVCQAALPHLRKSKGGRIINISSNAGRMGGLSNSVAYSASKGGLIALTYALARRLASDGITVNCIAPGPVATDMFASYSPDDAARVISTIPTGKLTLPAEIATAVAYFSSLESSNTTGAVLDINGGMFTG